MDAICIRDLKRDLKKNMDESRYEHTLGVCIQLEHLPCGMSAILTKHYWLV